MTFIPGVSRFLGLALLGLLVLYATAGAAQASGADPRLGADTRAVRTELVPGSSPLVTLDSPPVSSSGTSLSVNGWAIDAAAISNAGIDAVYVYLWASDANGSVPGGTQTGAATFSAQASYGGQRPDI